MKSLNKKQIGCYAMFILMILSASFKILRYGPSVHFYVYPLPDIMLNSVGYIELICGILYLIGVKKVSFRVYGGIIVIPLLIGAVGSHIAFGWFNLFDGISEPFHFTLPSFIILCLAIWISHKPIVKFVKSGFKMVE